MVPTSCVRQHGTEVGPPVLEGTKVQLFQVLSFLDCALIERFFALLADETKSTTEVGYNQPRVAQRGDPK